MLNQEEAYLRSWIIALLSQESYASWRSTPSISALSSWGSTTTPTQ